MVDKIDDLFEKTKGNLFLKKGSGFLGSILAKVKFSWREDIPTAGINPDSLVWNPDFFLSLDKDTRVTVLAHELWHNGYLHGIRRGERCPDVWNIAGDHVINLMLNEHKYYMGGFDYVMDPKYSGWSTDEIYDDLNKPGGGGACSENPLLGDILPVDGNDPKVVAEAVAKVVAATHTARITNQAGDIPGEVELEIDKFLSPQLPWPTILFNFFNELTNQEYSYARPNRRYEDPLIRGRTGRNGLDHLIYYVDVSGSITDDQVLRMNSEVKSIKEDLEPEKLTLVTFDTKIRNIYEFEKDEPFEKIVIVGRGGTSLEDVFQHMRQNGPNAAVIFTDLEVDIPDNPGIPIIWACTDNPNATVPYGTLLHIKD